MSRRFYSEPGRIIVSKEGYDASPSLADDRKLMDSEWFFSGLIIARGIINNPPSQPITINFPAQPYVPAAEVFGQMEDGFNGVPRLLYFGRASQVVNNGIPQERIYSNRIELPDGGYNGLFQKITWVVYGMAQ